MKFKRFLILLYFFLFWICYFIVARIIFFLFNTPELAGISFSEILATFFYGFKLDISAASYITFFSIPVFIISAFFSSNKVLKISLNIFTGIMIAIVSLIIIGDAEVYKYWAFRLDNSPLKYLNTPELIIASTTTLRIVFLFFIYLIFCLVSYFLYSRLISGKIKNTQNEKFYSIFYLLIAGILFIPIRGGVGIAPINAGSVYHSNNMFLNHSAINVTWNFGNSFFAKDLDFDSFQYFEETQKDKFYSEAIHSEDTCINIFNNNKPKHIIFIVLESFTANAIGVLGGEKGLTPGIDKWSEKGILFNNFYASADRSDKGLVSIFSSAPIVLNYSLMKIPGKSRHLPGLISELSDNGYKSSFYYGGDINFANMQSYILQTGFQEIKSQNNLKMNCAESSKWGYHDECMLDLLYKDIINAKDTSVFALFTLSSHEPYDIPGKKIFPENDEMNKARNSYFYTDSCINIFLENLYNSPKWDESLIILVSDHGTRFPGNTELWDLPKFHTLMLWLGGSLKTEPFIYTQAADQTDISASLLAQLNIDHKKFIFSEDLFRKKTPSAFYSFNHGYGFIKGNEYFVYDINTNKPIIENYNIYNMPDYTKAYMQQVTEYYKKLNN
ncbi:MAG: sulfatase-like hydrolase/transferase [Bacteroidales bacterium]|jgi:phosphoglycerol transferase MdoB-like AlkP superfamily enzyme|nr:sulfatase-like hydrolase/transferase [Bacteroidales bacterium]